MVIHIYPAASYSDYTKSADALTLDTLIQWF